MRLAAAVSDCLGRGGTALLPAGTGGAQLLRGVAALTTARSLLLSSPRIAGSGALLGLAFQPSWQAAAAGGAALLACGVPEGRLRRVEGSPLAASGRGSPQRLGAAVCARVQQRGYTAVRGTGAAAAAAAIASVAHARRALLAAGLDIAVVPMTEWVEASTLPPPASGRSGRAGGAREEEDGGPPRLVRVMVLHVVRCAPEQPWVLQPWAVERRRAPHRQAAGAPSAGAQTAAAPSPRAPMQQQLQQLQQPAAQLDERRPTFGRGPLPELLPSVAKACTAPALALPMRAPRWQRQQREHTQQRDQQLHMDDGSLWYVPA